MRVTPIAVLWAIPGSARTVASNTVNASSHIGPIENASRRFVHATLAGASCEWCVMRHRQYTLTEQ